MLPWPSGTVLEARGMVETSRVVPSDGARGCEGVDVGGVEEEEKGELSQENMPPFDFEVGGGGWSISAEEQLGDFLLLSAGGSDDALVKGVCFGPLFLSHASRVAWSTGQTSTGASVEEGDSLDILCNSVVRKVKEGEWLMMRSRCSVLTLKLLFWDATIGWEAD